MSIEPAAAQPAEPAIQPSTVVADVHPAMPAGTPPHDSGAEPAPRDTYYSWYRRIRVAIPREHT